MNALVSIIIPVYNAEKSLRRCLDSVLEQSYPDTEIVIINDGSTDNSISIINEYSLQNTNIRLISQESAGPSAARNTGIREAKGNYITFVDSDDYLEITAISDMMVNQKEYDSDLVIANHIRHEGNKIISFETSLPEVLNKDTALQAFLEKKIKVGCCGKIYNRSFLIERNLFFPEDRYGEDIYHLFNMIISDAKITWLNKPVYHVVNTETSVCNTFNPKFLLLLDTMKYMKAELVNNELWNSHRRQFYEYYSDKVLYLVNYFIRFEHLEYIDEILSQSIYKRFHIPVRLKDGVKSAIANMIFNINIRLYIYLKEAKRKNKG